MNRYLSHSLAVLLLGVLTLNFWSVQAAPQSGKTLLTNISLAEKQLQKDFPNIQFEFDKDIHDWYKYLLLESMEVFPKKHMKGVGKIHVQSYKRLKNRGLFAITNKGGSLKLNSIRFPMETKLKCKNVNSCLSVSKDRINRQFIAVAIHELAHWVDLGASTRGNAKSGNSPFLDGKVRMYKDDSSVQHYGLCFKDAKHLAKGACKRSDFVSMYAKTGVFEDYAETVTAFVLDGENFYEKALKYKDTKGRDILLKKYNFFKKLLGKEYRFGVRATSNSFATYDTTKRKFPVRDFLLM